MIVKRKKQRYSVAYAVINTKTGKSVPQTSRVSAYDKGGAKGQIRRRHMSGAFRTKIYSCEPV